MPIYESPSLNRSKLLNFSVSACSPKTGSHPSPGDLSGLLDEWRRWEGSFWAFCKHVSGCDPVLGDHADTEKFSNFDRLKMRLS